MEAIDRIVEVENECAAKKKKAEADARLAVSRAEAEAKALLEEFERSRLEADHARLEQTEAEEEARLSDILKQAEAEKEVLLKAAGVRLDEAVAFITEKILEP